MDGNCYELNRENIYRIIRFMKNDDGEYSGGTFLWSLLEKRIHSECVEFSGAHFSTKFSLFLGIFQKNFTQFM